MIDENTILTSIEAQIASPEFKARLLAVLARHGLYHPPRSSLIHYRAEAAAKMLSGHSRPETRDALRERFGVSRRSAYRLISRAIDLRQMRLFEE